VAVQRFVLQECAVARDVATVVFVCQLSGRGQQVGDQLGRPGSSRQVVFGVCFETFEGDRHASATYALLGGLSLSPKVCHWVSLARLAPGGLLQGEGHVGIKLQMQREAFVQTKRDDVPPCSAQSIDFACRLGCLEVHHGDDFAASLATSADAIVI
jgi:hypothetical protein